MDPRPRPLLHFLVRMKPKPTNVFLPVAKVTKGKDLGCTEDVEVFPSQISEALSLTRLAVWGRALSCKRMIPSDSIPGCFDFMARRSTLSHKETNLTSLLFFARLHFQCWTYTLYTTLASRAINKQLCGPVRFHIACLIPYRWQYRYAIPVLPAFGMNEFYGGCLIFILLSHINTALLF